MVLVLIVLVQRARNVQSIDPIDGTSERATLLCFDELLEAEHLGLDVCFVAEHTNAREGERDAAERSAAR